MGNASGFGGGFGAGAMGGGGGGRGGRGGTDPKISALTESLMRGGAGDPDGTAARAAAAAKEAAGREEKGIGEGDLAEFRANVFTLGQVPEIAPPEALA